MPDYVASLDRATRALAGLQASPLQTNQKAMNEMSALLRFGAKSLEQLFKEILRAQSIQQSTQNKQHSQKQARKTLTQESKIFPIQGLKLQINFKSLFHFWILLA